MAPEACGLLTIDATTMDGSGRDSQPVGEPGGTGQGGIPALSDPSGGDWTAECRLDAALLDRAYRDQVLMRRWPFRLAIAILVAVAVADDLRRGPPGPVTFVGVAVLLLMIAIYAFVWQRLRTSVRETVHRMGGGAVRYTFGRQALTMESKLGRSEFPWDSLARLEVRRAYSLVFVGSHEWITLPTKDLEPDGIARLIERCRAASVPVADRR